MGTGWKAALVLMMLVMFFSGAASAGSDVGAVVAVKNRAIIAREKQEFDAKVKDGIFSIDTVTTLEASRAKMLFRDDSVLTLGEKSRLVVKEYVYNEGQRGASVFNLIDGKMKAIVGNTNFEVHTPTALAGARGTVILFENGVVAGRRRTTIISEEGSVEIKNIDSNIPKKIILEPHWMTTVWEGEAPTEPEPAPLELIVRLSGQTDMGYQEITVIDPVVTETGLLYTPDLSAGSPAGLPPINQQPPAPETAASTSTSSPVNVRVVFP
ncbi:MAG: FecR domain-containing protein [Nitrospirae bacterium]|nr:FecR domain-containing protein [Nitrospirota bacterium]